MGLRKTFLKTLLEKFIEGKNPQELSEVRPIDDYIAYWEENPRTCDWERDRVVRIATLTHWIRIDLWATES